MEKIGLSMRREMICVHTCQSEYRNISFSCELDPLSHEEWWSVIQEKSDAFAGAAWNKIQSYAAFQTHPLSSWACSRGERRPQHDLPHITCDADHRHCQLPGRLD